MAVIQLVEPERLKSTVCVTIDKFKKTELTFLSQGDYDVVINDYEKAKSLFGNTEVPVFKKGISFLFSFRGFYFNKWMKLSKISLFFNFSLCFEYSHLE